MGALHTGSCGWSAHGDVVLEIPQTRVIGGLCSWCGVGPGLSGLRGGISVPALPEAADYGASRCGWPPIGGFSSPGSSVPCHVTSLFTVCVSVGVCAGVCECKLGRVCVCVCACVCGGLGLYVGVGGTGFHFLFMSHHFIVFIL